MIRPSPAVDRAIAAALRAVNDAASTADRTCDPRSADLHRLSESLLALLAGPTRKTEDAA
jgi:hypothetical protein